MKESAIKSLLASEYGAREANRFIQALEGHRIFAIVRHVSSSGMTRYIDFREVATDASGRINFYNFTYFLESIRFKYSDKYYGHKVEGCGMDMIFHTLNYIAGTLKHYGFDVPENYSRLASDYISL